jgi:hypothetical protein
MRIGFLERIDLFQEYRDGDVQRRLFRGLTGRFEAGHSPVTVY